MEIDHIFICTEARSGDVLVDFGLKEGSSNTHPGQGTACRRFYFQNMMLELLWVEDVEAVLNQRTRPMRLYERCAPASDSVSPFGIALRPKAEQLDELPFAVWDYHPEYLPDFLKMEIATHTDLSEPMVFYISFAKRQDSVSADRREPMQHQRGFKEVTFVKIHTQAADLSDATLSLNSLHQVAIVPTDVSLMELEFDHASQKQCKDFRPDLPLIFRW